MAFEWVLSDKGEEFFRAVIRESQKNCYYCHLRRGEVTEYRPGVHKYGCKREWSDLVSDFYENTVGTS